MHKMHCTNTDMYIAFKKIKISIDLKKKKNPHKVEERRKDKWVEKSL